MAHSSWGPGWPNCQTSKINRRFYVDTRWGRVTFPGGVRNEIAELVARLVKETANRGYRFGVPGNASYGCWGFSCRAIRGSSRPSNHSWGLAVDINAPKNPMGSRLITDMPGWMPDLWNAYGFRWGGDYVTRPDAMHYEFMGSVTDAARMTTIARKNQLGEIRTSTPPKPPVPKPPTNEEDDDVFILMKGDKTPNKYLTNGMHKREMKDQDEINFFVFVLRAKGAKVHTGDNNQPEVWPQKYVDNIANSDNFNLVDATHRVYSASGESPLHDVIRQATTSESA